MTAELKIEDVRNQILTYETFTKVGLSPLYEFFQFSRYPRNFFNPGVLQDCFLYNLHITHYVQTWPSQPGPPHPGMFEDFFTTIMDRLVDTGNTLTFFIKDIDKEYFDEAEIINTLLAPKNLRHILLGNPIAPGDRRTQVDTGHLIFEWPLEALSYVVEQWFISPQVSIEGYVGSSPPLATIGQLYFQSDTEQRIRELLRSIDFAFKLWSDNNGLFLLSDKVDIEALKRRLKLSDLNPKLEEAAHRYV